MTFPGVVLGVHRKHVILSLTGGDRSAEDGAEQRRASDKLERTPLRLPRRALHAQRATLPG